ncbi:sugar phosphate isomerase/epimerase [Robinsoniella peoriensis]|uniref:sugar phosphate isomerase/epimerase family protein n=1 Tax=Robinsoniella peoriensis TaxID=180332 RepID=UPI0005C7D04A|nr:sugar phosphate isomerase/epimerase family protein [Robinsoniella peoriensis]
MKIGVRAHDYGKMEIEELAEVLHKEGYQAAQLALPKAFKGIEQYSDISLKHLERIRKAFEEHQIEIPVFGCYMDLGNPDEEIRANGVQNLKMCLAYSKEVGAKVVGTETAYPHLSKEQKKIWYPFMMDSIKRVMEEAQKLDVKLAVEPVYWHPLENVEAVLDVIDQVQDSEHLRLIFDASNLLEFPENTDQEKYWSQWLDKIGGYIDVMHIKDFTLDDNRTYVPARLGEGIIAYDTIIQWLRQNKPDMYLLREEMNPEFARADIAFLKKF